MRAAAVAPSHSSGVPMRAALDPSLARGTSSPPSGAARYEAHVLESLGRPGTCSAARAIVSVGLLLLKVCGTLVTSTAGTEPPTPPFPGAAEPPAKTVAWSLGAILPPEFTATVVSQPYLGLVSTPPPSTTPTPPPTLPASRPWCSQPSRPPWRRWRRGRESR